MVHPETPDRHLHHHCPLVTVPCPSAVHRRKRIYILALTEAQGGKKGAADIVHLAQETLLTVDVNTRCKLHLQCTRLVALKQSCPPSGDPEVSADWSPDEPDGAAAHQRHGAARAHGAGPRGGGRSGCGQRLGATKAMLPPFPPLQSLPSRVSIDIAIASLNASQQEGLFSRDKRLSAVTAPRNTSAQNWRSCKGTTKAGSSYGTDQ